MILRRSHSGTLNESTIVGVADLEVGGPELWISDRWVTRDEADDVYPGSGPLNGGKTLRPALVYIDGVSSTELIYHKIICCGLKHEGMMNNVIMIYRLVWPRLI